jgi:hypothetical protein
MLALGFSRGAVLAARFFRMASRLQGHPQHPLHDPITIDENVRQRHPDRNGASM